jgi:hypothetical protein
MDIERIDKENVNLHLSIQELQHISDAFATHLYQGKGGDSKDMARQIEDYLVKQYKKYTPQVRVTLERHIC